MPGTMNFKAKLSSAAVMVASAALVAGFATLPSSPVASTAAKIDPVVIASIADEANVLTDRVEPLDNDDGSLKIRQVSDRVTVVIRSGDNPALVAE